MLHQDKRMPQIMVISTSTHSALLKRENSREAVEVVNGGSACCTGMRGTHNAPQLGSILRNPTRVSNIVHKENPQRASVLQHVSQNVRRLQPCSPN
jgi:hypothetical protein